jgi:apolipoprotein D and lipocalin family protein
MQRRARIPRLPAFAAMQVKNSPRLTSALWLILACSLAGCTGIPAGITPVNNFDINRYLGTWYEIARLDHIFERGLQQVTADYSPRDDGGVNVLNRGLSGDGEWRSAQGAAYFVGPDDQGYLKVSFFGPFYASYIVFELDEQYQYAFVCGNNRSYLWLLARTPHIGDALRERFLERAGELGFDTSQLIFVSQEADSNAVATLPASYNATLRPAPGSTP